MKNQSTKNPYVTEKAFVVNANGKSDKKPASEVTKSQTDMRVKGGK
jgi:hypothetical protein